jgi:hypothetical protein
MLVVFSGGTYFQTSPILPSVRIVSLWAHVHPWNISLEYECCRFGYWFGNHLILWASVCWEDLKWALFVLSTCFSVCDGGGSGQSIVRTCWTGSGWNCRLMMPRGVWIFYIQLSSRALQHTRFVEEYYCNTRSSFFVSKRTKVIFGHWSRSKLLSVLKGAKPWSSDPELWKNWW